MIHFFTSAAANYLPKARVLGRSLKKHHPEAVLTLVLCDAPPPGFDLAREPFDRLLLPEELGIPDFERWAYQHSVVEMCTAVKGRVLRRLLEAQGTEAVFYMDPDTVVFSGLGEFLADFGKSSILLSPHQTAPETTPERIEKFEIPSLVYGVFNLGFLGVAPTDHGRAFARWWEERLLGWCYDEPERGLFTDQRWCNLVPCLFDGVSIVRDPRDNVCHWNLSNRRLSKDAAGRYLADGRPIRFFHFSGWDFTGNLDEMIERKQEGAFIGEVKEWYTQRLAEEGQSELGATPWRWGRYSNGEPVAKLQRVYYRWRRDLQDRFPSPFDASDSATSWLHWYKANAPHSAFAEAGMVNVGVLDCLRVIDQMHASWSWRIGQALTAPARLARNAFQGRG